MRSKRSLSGTVVLAGLLILIVLAVVRGQVRTGAAVVSENAGGSTAVDIGGAIMVDPQGDTELAKLVLAGAKARRHATSAPEPQSRGR